MTALERKLERLAAQIGQLGLAAALLSLGAMAGQFRHDLGFWNSGFWI